MHPPPDMCLCQSQGLPETQIIGHHPNLHKLEGMQSSTSRHVNLLCVIVCALCNHILSAYVYSRHRARHGLIANGTSLLVPVADGVQQMHDHIRRQPLADAQHVKSKGIARAKVAFVRCRWSSKLHPQQTCIHSLLQMHTRQAQQAQLGTNTSNQLPPATKVIKLTPPSHVADGVQQMRRNSRHGLCLRCSGIRQSAGQGRQHSDLRALC